MLLREAEFFRTEPRRPSAVARRLVALGVALAAAAAFALGVAPIWGAAVVVIAAAIAGLVPARASAAWTPPPVTLPPPSMNDGRDSREPPISSAVFARKSPAPPAFPRPNVGVGPEVRGSLSSFTTEMQVQWFARDSIPVASGERPVVEDDDDEPTLVQARDRRVG